MTEVGIRDFFSSLAATAPSTASLSAQGEGPYISTYAPSSCLEAEHGGGGEKKEAALAISQLQPLAEVVEKEAARCE